MGKQKFGLIFQGRRGPEKALLLRRNKALGLDAKLESSESYIFITATTVVRHQNSSTVEGTRRFRFLPLHTYECSFDGSLVKTALTSRPRNAGVPHLSQAYCRERSVQRKLRPDSPLTRHVCSHTKEEEIHFWRLTQSCIAVLKTDLFHSLSLSLV